VAILQLALAMLLGLAVPAHALVDFDFEQRVVLEPGAYIKDHSLVFRDGAYHLYYTVGNEGEGWGQAGNEIDFGHATSHDLVHWTFEPRILGIDPTSWKNRNLWAPHVERVGALGYRLYYTGIDSSVVQQIGIASSADLMTWTDESVATAAYHPDTTWALWAPGRWSNCRDAFVLDLGTQWLLLATASAKPAYAGSERGALALAFSPDGMTWTDAGAPFVMNDGPRVLESPFLFGMDDRYYLLFTEAGVTGVQLASSSSLLSGWDVTQASVFEDKGFAAEVVTVPGATLMTRVRGLYQPDGTLTRSVLIDTLYATGNGPRLGASNRLWQEWIPIEGDTAFMYQPTFGDRPLARTGIPSGVEGHFWINTAERYGEPVTDGCHDCPPDEARTGIIRSHVFPVTGQRMTLWVGGGAEEESLYVALRRLSDGEFLFRETGTGGDELTERTWNLDGLAGTAVQIEIADLATDGHVNVDAIREQDPVIGIGSSDGDTGDGAPGLDPAALRVTVAPSPAAAGDPVRVSFALPRSAAIELDVVDPTGRRVALLLREPRAAGLHRLRWEARLADGRLAPRGVYFVRLVAAGEMIATKFTLSR
jgi:hypothetical protein